MLNYEKLPKHIENIKPMPIVSTQCKSTMFIFLLTIATLIIPIIGFVPGIILKIIVIIPAIAVCIIMWTTGLLGFFQKSIVKEPGDAELEVVMAGLNEYAKIVDSK